MTPENKNNPPENTRHFVDRELKELSPELAQHAHIEDLVGPEYAYFQRMQDEVMQKIAVKKHRRFFSVPVYVALRPVLRIAAVVAITVFAFWLWQRPADKGGVLNFTDLPDVAILAYLTEHIHGFEEESLLEIWAYEGEELFSFADLQDDDMDQYLHDHPEFWDQLSEFDFY